MRYKAGHKAATHAAIITSAAQQLRMHGIEGVSVDGLMQQIHLTHGGFYAHFATKDDLVRETVLASLQSADSLAAQAVHQPPGEGLAWLIRTYLSRTHRDHPETGCILPALAGEIARQTPMIQSAFSEGLASYIERVVTLLPGDDDATKRSTARYLLASMAGAVALARAVADRDLSSAILTSTRHALMAQFGITPRRP